MSNKLNINRKNNGLVYKSANNFNKGIKADYEMW